MGTLDVKELTVSIIKSGVNTEHPSSIVITAIGMLVVLLSV